MPLIIICGTPVSGKTRRTRELKEFLEKTHSKEVAVVSEDEAIVKLGYEKSSMYLDSQKEKRVRGYLKSEVIRLVRPNNVVILDGSNYIKGYRYELYCASKATKSTQCTVYTICYHDEAWQANLERLQQNELNCDSESQSSSEAKQIDCNNVPYTQEVFDALSKLRFEEPNSNSRWDSPLFTVHPSDQLDLDSVYQVLFERKPPPPNMSTQNPPLSSTNFIQDLDRVTQTIAGRVLDTKKGGGGDLHFKEYPGCELDSGFVNLVTPQKLSLLRRQFMTFAKMNHCNEDMAKIGRYFIQYLNKTLVE